MSKPDPTKPKLDVEKLMRLFDEPVPSLYIIEGPIDWEAHNKAIKEMVEKLFEKCEKKTDV